MPLVLNSAGLGDTYKVDSAGNIIDCDSWNNFFQGVCWNPGSATVQATTTTVTNSDGSTSTVLAAATPANTSLTTPSAWCNFLDCDSSGNLELDATNLMWAGAAMLLAYVVSRLLK